MAMLFALFILAIFQLCLCPGSIASPSVVASKSRDESGVVKSPLDVFEVRAPLRASYEGASCEQVVLQHTFAASYGTPYVGMCKNCREV